ncbi:universal stress protein [Streptacidiphilus fuscans]|uniref:Universal stress protein n=1 Tax=Streptacidiphilus fuscans TaxID=2789292 RepID=A0A931FDH0_9ACTN|nr:universal stress protein [Streptacidiphilus fuscans]MBF9066499.1 universal stress protein [Streptacidiphilus fuscans]
MAQNRVVVGVNGSENSLAALHRAAEEARRRGAVLVPVLVWHPVGGEMAYRSHPCPPLLKQWQQAACDRLDAAFDTAFGGCPADLTVEPLVVRAERPGPALVEIADQPGDLLVVGTGKQGRLTRLFHGSVSRYCLAHARGSVLGVSPTATTEPARPARRSETSRRATLSAAA